MSNNDFDCIIVGAGASGMMCASILAKSKLSVAILDGNERVGRKLSLTGNGRCNLTNDNLDTSRYYTDSRPLLEQALKAFSASRTLDFFEKELGVITTSKDGLRYPFTNKASTVVDALRFYCSDNGISLLLSNKVKSITKKADRYELYTTEGQLFSAKTVVVACGGKSYAASGSDGSGYSILSGFEDASSFERLAPSLVQLVINDCDITSLSGTKANVVVKLLVGHHSEQTIAQEEGELLFTDYGVSGICIMQLSSACIDYAAKNSRYPILSIDFFKDYSFSQSVDLIKDRKERFSQRSCVDALSGMLPSKLIEVILKHSQIVPDMSISQLTDTQINNLSKQLNCFNVKINGTKGFDTAQVTRGGLKLSTLKGTSMELNNHDGLYACGEILNVDGPCGGYNLQWAWTSGALAAYGVLSKLQGGNE